MVNLGRALAAAALAAALPMAIGAAHAQHLIIGVDQKQTYDDAAKPIFAPPGKDTATIVDISNRTKPKIVANLPIPNTIVGPPVNLAITPDEHLALIANSLEEVSDGSGGWKPASSPRAWRSAVRATSPSSRIAPTTP